jgi:L-histidine N-alpha-methyltransferase
VPDLAKDVLDGLLQLPRTLPPKYFYDVRGSQLFEQICTTPEYYPTRTEDKLLANYGKDIIEKTKPEQILELGSGNSQKTRRLFDACTSIDHACEYAPFDVCEPMLEETAEKLQSDYDWLTVKPLLGDYHAGLGNLPDIDGIRLFIFLGSTIGNFTPEETNIFFSEIRQCMKPGDYFLLGADRVKKKFVLDAAYNDAQGITAEFFSTS